MLFFGPQTVDVCSEWPGGFVAYQEVIHGERTAVVQKQVWGIIVDGKCHYYCREASPKGKRGLVPIRYDDGGKDANRNIYPGLFKGGWIKIPGKLFWVHYKKLNKLKKKD